MRGDSRVERLEVGPGQDSTTAAERLRRLPGVEFAEPNFLVRHDQVTPNDPKFSEQWALRNSGQNGGMVGSDVGATTAWRETVGTYSTVVAVVDSGIDFAHPDLAAGRWLNPGEVASNGLDDDRDGYPDDVSGWDWVANSGVVRDEQGHGTSVAGILAAEGNNGTGLTGVMWRASLMSLRVLDSGGTGDVAGAVEAIDYAVAHGASVINCSWGTEADSQFLKDAIDRAGRKGVVVVASAGNAGRDIDAQPYYPASYDLSNLISVTSSDGFDNLATFSNRGATRVAVAAPGVEILTTQLGGDYHVVSGTSASAPIVAGIAGLIKTVRPNATAAAVRAAVLAGTRRVDALTSKVSSGGVADAAGALAVLRGNPYAGGDGAHGNGHGNGQGGGRPYVPPALRKDNEHGRGRDKKGIIVTPPGAGGGAPGANLPDLDASRKVRTSPAPRAFSAPIQANLMCADCDSSGGGGGGQSYPNDPYFGTARMLPLNDVGDQGVDLGSRNFDWALPIVLLPGRARPLTHALLQLAGLDQAGHVHPVQRRPRSSQTLLSSVVVAGVLDSYHFDYNSYGQVYKITHKAPDGHELAHTRYNLSDAELNAVNNGAQTDCPRFTSRYDYAQNWNDGAEAVTTYSVTENATWNHPDTQVQETGRLTRQTTPDGTTVNVFSHSSGWDAGLPRLEQTVATELVNNTPTQVLKKWTLMVWTQDNTSLPYSQNERLTDIKLYDGTNVSHTSIDYNSGFGLPTTVREWGLVGGQLTLLRRTETEYNLGSAYLNSRVIGLPWRVLVYDGGGALVSKRHFFYDWDGWHLEDIPNVTIPQHDPAYSASYAAGRGNLVLMQRFDVTDTALTIEAPSVSLSNRRSS